MILSISSSVGVSGWEGEGAIGARFGFIESYPWVPIQQMHWILGNLAKYA